MKSTIDLLKEVYKAAVTVAFHARGAEKELKIRITGIQELNFALRAYEIAHKAEILRHGDEIKEKENADGKG